MADSSSVQLYYAEETTWGEDPTALSPLPTLKEFRFTGEGLDKTTATAVSEEIVADRQTKDIVRVSVGAGGDVGLELSYAAHDDLVQGAMYDTWDTLLDYNGGSPLDGSVTIGVGSPQNLAQISFPDSPVTAAITAVRVGSFIYVTGSAASPSNNGFYQVTDNSGGVLTVSPSFSAAETGSALRVRASHIRNGTTRRSFLLEKQFTDVSPLEAMYFPGMRVGQWGLDIQPGSIITGSFQFLGKNGFMASPTVGKSTTTAAATNDVMNAVDNIGNVKYNGSTAAFNLTQVSFQIANALREQPAIANLANIGIGLGRVQMTGTLNAYFEDRALINDYLSFNTRSLSFSAIDNAGNAYHFNFPSFKFTNGRVVAEGNDQDVLAQMEFTCRKDPTYGYTIGVGRYAA